MCSCYFFNYYKISAKYVILTLFSETYLWNPCPDIKALTQFCFHCGNNLGYLLQLGWTIAWLSWNECVNSSNQHDRLRTASLIETISWSPSSCELHAWAPRWLGTLGYHWNVWASQNRPGHVSVLALLIPENIGQIDLYCLGSRPCWSDYERSSLHISGGLLTMPCNWSITTHLIFLKFSLLQIYGASMSAELTAEQVRTF